MKKIFFLFIIYCLSIQAQVWNTQMVNPGGISSSDCIFYDSNDYPVIIYSVGYVLNLSRWNGNSWNTHIISSMAHFGWAGKQDSLIFIYHSDPWSNMSFLQYNLNNNVISGLQDPTNFTSYNHFYIKFGKIYRAYILSINSIPSELFLQIFDIGSGTWSVRELIDAPSYIQDPFIAVSENGTVWISYYDYSGKNLKIARKVGSNLPDIWFVDTEGNVGYNSQIYFEDEVPNIIYYDATNKRLKHATFNP